MNSKRDRRTSVALTLELLFQNLFSYTTDGIVFTGLALWLGATTFQIGLLGSIGSIGFLAILSAPWLVRAAGGSRRTVLMAAYSVRLCSRTGILLLLLLNPTHAVWWLAILAGVSHFAGSLYAPLSRAWISSAIPSNEHNRYLSNRLSVAMLGAVVAPPLAGFFIDTFPAPTGFALAFGTGLAFGTIALWLVSIAHDPAPEQNHPASLSRGKFLKSLRFPLFRRMYLFQTATALADGLTSSFLNILYLKYLGLSFFLINAFVSAAKGAKGLSAFGNRWLQKHYEPLQLFQVSVIVIAIAPIALLGARPGAAFLVAISLILTEAARGIMSPNEQTLIMRWGSAIDQTGDFSLIFFSRNLVGTFTPLLTAAVLRTIFNLDVQAETINPHPIHIVIIASVILKTAALLLLPRKEKSLTQL